MFRQHQDEFGHICHAIRMGEAPHLKSVICSITPGGGKSFLPLIAASQLLPAIADRICWIVPRRALQLQAEEEFLQPRGRNALGHAHIIRRAADEADPCRGLSGFATTYQAVGVGNGHLAREFSRHRYVLFLDEPHHVEEGGAWEQCLAPLVRQARLTVFMSGTLERGNRKRIAFLPYRWHSEGEVVDLAESPQVASVHYTRGDALREKAILPIHFELMDGSAQWIGRDGETYGTQLSEAGKDVQEALYTALKTQFAEQLLDECAAHWADYRASHPRSKLLVVTADIGDAKKYVEHLKKRGVRAAIATSDDSSRAQANIGHFKSVGTAKALDALVTVAMAYEGLDVPSITHIACLTHIRSKPWIEQMLARATRFDAQAGPWESQMAYVYVPDDRNMCAIIAAMQDEQLSAVKGGTGDDDPNYQPPERVAPEERNAIVPVGSEAGLRRSSRVGTMSLFEPSGSVAVSEPIITPSQREEEMRGRIQSLCRQVDAMLFDKRWGETNKRVIKVFGVSRQKMTLTQLERVLGWLKETYGVE